MKSDLIKRHKATNKHRTMEKKWNERFILEKIPQYDAYKDINYLSLGLVRSKLRYEEKQIKEGKKTKKLRTNSTRQTLNTKSRKNMYSPLPTTLKENEKTDLFTLKLTKRPLTIKRKKMKLNKTLDSNNILEKKEEKNNYVKTVENQKIYNSTHKNNNENNDKEYIVIDKALGDELNEIKELWENLGVTQEYQIFFGEMLDKLKTREFVEKYLLYEKRQLIEFKSDLEKLMNDIYKRENDLSNLKKIEEIYAKNEQLNQYNILKNKKYQNRKIKNKNNKSLGQSSDEINQYRNKNGNEYDEDNVEKSKELDEELTKYKVNKEKIENDIGNCLKLLRLHTINIVSQFTKFRINYNFYSTSGKNDVNQMKNGYEFDYNYLLKIKKDCEFFKKSSFKNIYNFTENCENDPFFLNLLNNKNHLSKYKYLTATEDTINSIHECMFILDQEEMYFKISQNQNNTNENNETKYNNESSENDNINENETSNSNIKNKKITRGVNYQGNLENVISKLRKKNEYQNLFFNSGYSKGPFTNNNNFNNNLNENLNENGQKTIPETTSNELFQSFQYYDKIKNNIYNKEEIQNIKNNMFKNYSNSNNKIIIYSKNNTSKENKDKFSNKGNNNLNLNFNNIVKNSKKQNGNNSLKISLNNINKICKNDEKMQKKNSVNINLNNISNNLKANNNKFEENKKQENNIIITNNDIIRNDNYNNNNSNNNNYDKNNKNEGDNKNIDNNITNNSNLVEEEIILDEKCINCKYISILSLIDKQNLSIEKENNNFNIGNYLFRMMNPFNLDLLLNSLKYNNKYSISNCSNSIVLSSPEEIKNNFSYIINNNNSISNINSLEKEIKEKDLYLSEDNNSQKKYAFLSSLLNINLNSLISSSSIIYNNHNYNGIKINSTKNILSIEDDIILYIIPTENEDILIYICPYNEKIKEIIKKYDKNNNIFNGFSSFVNIISLYYEENDNNDDTSEINLWLPCFEIDTQLICNKMPGYKKINIKNNNDNKDMQIFEYDEIIKISMKQNLNNNKNMANININKNEDIVIENDFIFGIYHKEMKNRYNTPFISLAYIGKENFI